MQETWRWFGPQDPMGGDVEWIIVDPWAWGTRRVLRWMGS
ncbi:hypothetical protein KT71_002551 [Congregibacter litoralis KT71]|uniref:Uncharacterized protein n=1 Tax=Congregibacter litoralis KT71 TaxID=314285 RepID=V7HSB3_9GAMM|nr:hypothetical protein KT71_002551 [Congregibacter litoralis KT71]